jgi:hypothetical protein
MVGNLRLLLRGGGVGVPWLVFTVLFKRSSGPGKGKVSREKLDGWFPARHSGKKLLIS